MTRPGLLAPGEPEVGGVAPAAARHVYNLDNYKPMLSPPCSHYLNPQHERRVRSAWTVAVDCDLLVFVVDACRQLLKPDPRIAKVIADYGSGAPPAGLAGSQWSPPPAVLVLNKVDMVQREQRPALLALADQLQASTAFQETFWVSALRGKSAHGVPAGMVLPWA